MEASSSSPDMHQVIKLLFIYYVDEGKKGRKKERKRERERKK
jgi:hypothetical protein